MTDTPALTGGCLCGAFRYTIAAEPVMVAHCACDSCRKRSGSEHATVFGVPADAVSTTGETRSYTSTGDSGGTVTRHFCPNCGSNAMNESSTVPHLRMFPVGCLDDISRVQPGVFVFHANKAPWDNAGAGIATFDAMPPMK